MAGKKINNSHDKCHMVMKYVIALQTEQPSNNSLLGTAPRAVPFQVLTCPQ